MVVVEAPGEALKVGLHELSQPRSVARVQPQLLEVELALVVGGGLARPLRHVARLHLEVRRLVARQLAHEGFEAAEVQLVLVSQVAAEPGVCTAAGMEMGNVGSWLCHALHRSTSAAQSPVAGSMWRCRRPFP